ncbi:MAG: hypothetical protein B7733_05945 [Myxococcales bacterium FL481]|nr:MAG: hypothetical protein B7733_05945 [Myxococcales bacterium FL481]
MQIDTAGTNAVFEVRFDGSAAGWGPLDLSDHDLVLVVASDDMAGFDSSDFVVDVGEPGYSSFVRCRQYSTSQAQHLIPPHHTLSGVGDWVILGVHLSGDGTTNGPLTKTNVQDVKVRVNDNNRNIRVRIAYIGFARKSQVLTGCKLCFAFDDGRTSQRTFAAPEMRSHGLFGTYFITPNIPAGSSIEPPDTVMTLEQLQELSRDYGGMMGFHADTAALASSDMGWSAAGHRFLESEIRSAMAWIAKNGLNTDGGCASVRGEYNNNSRYEDPQISGHSNALPVLRKHFRYHRTVNEGFETAPVIDPYRLRSLSVQGSHTPTEIMDRIGEAAAENAIYILSFHSFVDGAGSGTQYSEADFASICSQVETEVGNGNVRVMHIGAAIDSCGGPLYFDPKGPIT